MFHPTQKLVISDRHLLTGHVMLRSLPSVLLGDYLLPTATKHLTL